MEPIDLVRSKINERISTIKCTYEDFMKVCENCERNVNNRNLNCEHENLNCERVTLRNKVDKATDEFEELVGYVELIHGSEMAIEEYVEQVRKIGAKIYSNFFD